MRNGQRGDSDLGWVGRYKEAEASRSPTDPRLPNRAGNVWTATTFGLFAVRDGAPTARAAEFGGFKVVQPAR